MIKLSLLVASPGKWQGKVIPINRWPFLIGRDPVCQLRPASSFVSNRHCALHIRQGKAYVRDLGSTNGTFLNDERVDSDRELEHGDWLRVGPLDFDVALEVTPAVNQPTPLPPNRGGARQIVNDDDVAALLLAVREEPMPEPVELSPAGGSVPTGRTATDINIRQPVEWEDIGGAIEVRFTDHKILDIQKILVIGQQLSSLVEQSSERRILLNLGTVRSMSTAMVEELLAFSNKVRSLRGQLVLCHVHPSIYPVFQHMKLAKVFTIRKDQHEALEAFR
jgi:anti-anti-sigma factor